MDYYFQVGEIVTIVDNALGYSGDYVVLDKVKNKRYLDPATGMRVHLDFDPSEEPYYWLEGVTRSMTMSWRWWLPTKSLSVFPQNLLQKKYETGDSFEKIMKWCKDVKYDKNDGFVLGGVIDHWSNFEQFGRK